MTTMLVSIAIALLGQVGLVGGQFTAQEVMVVLDGSQDNQDDRRIVHGVDRGIQKSDNLAMKSTKTDMTVFFLETAKGGVFVGEEAHVEPLVRRHIELIKPKAILSFGTGATFMDALMSQIPVADRPMWHLKCMQMECPPSKSGTFEKETCFQFRPEAAQLLKNIGLTRAIRKIKILVDGSSLANTVASDLEQLTTLQRQVMCGGCTIERQTFSTLTALTAALPATAQDAAQDFVLIPSIASASVSMPSEVWNALQGKALAAMVPWEVAQYGGLMSLRPHPGSSAEACSLMVANAEDPPSLDSYSIPDSVPVKISYNVGEAAALGNIFWQHGTLQHDGREYWSPIEFFDTAPSQMVQPSLPRILIAHAYRLSNGWTAGEHAGFVDGLTEAGHNLYCTEFGMTCMGSLQVNVLWWLSKQFFNSDADKKLWADYTKEYIARWMPLAVYTTDDNALSYLAIDCFEPLVNGPNPSYHDCSKTHYIAAGINADVKQAHADKCMVRDSSGECSALNHFVAEGSQAACTACSTGTEPECASCDYLYSKPRPVNITIHLEATALEKVLVMMKEAKPTTTKLVMIGDSSPSTVNQIKAYTRQYYKLVDQGLNHGISWDPVVDSHTVSSTEEVMSVLQSYQDSPEYMPWAFNLMQVLPGSADERGKFFRDFFNMNTLGEVVSMAEVPNQNLQGLLAVGSSADAEGRVCASYADLIVRGLESASHLPIVEDPLSGVWVNVDRSSQLLDYGVVPFSPKALSMVEKIFKLCPPGEFLKDGECTSCPGGTFKSDFGNEQETCETCWSLNGIPMISAKASVSSAACMCPKTHSQEPCNQSTALSNTNFCCILCEEGTYQDLPGQSECKSCTGGKTTRFIGAEFESACTCPPDTYVTPGDNSSCTMCGLGFSCTKWDLLAPDAAPGYMMPAEITPGIQDFQGEFPIFKCYGGADRCPGGQAGVCASGRRAIACSECKPNFSPAEGGSCEPCDGTSVLPFVVLTLLILVILGAFYISALQSSLRLGSDQIFLMTLGSVVIVFVQTVGILDVAFPWSGPMNSVMKVGTVFLFDIEVSKPTCIADIGKAGKFALQASIVPVGILVILGTYAAHMAAKYKADMRARTAILFNCLGSLNSAAFTSNVALVLGVFQCQEHPCGIQTLRQHMSVACWTSSEHQTMVVVGILFLSLPIAFISACAWASLRLPERASTGDALFLERWAWLFARFRVGCQWYGLMLFLRGLAMSVANTLTSRVAQVFTLQVTLTFFFGMLCIHRPWRSRSTDLLDRMVVSPTILVTTGMAPFFLDSSEANTAATTAAIIVIFCAATIPSVVLYKAYKFVSHCREKPFKFLVCHDKAAVGNVARAIKMYMERDQARSGRMCLDSDIVANMATLFDTVEKMTENLVVLCTHDVLTKPWCVGELCTAAWAQTSMQLVIFDDFSMPSSAFIHAPDEHVPELAVLLEYGMTANAVSQMLTWFKDRPQMSFPAQMSLPAINGLVSNLATNTVADVKADTGDAPNLSAATGIVANLADREAIAAAYIIQCALNGATPAYVLPAGVKVFLMTTTVILICSADCFLNPGVASALLAAAALKTRVLPIIVHGGTFPTPASLKRLAAKEEDIVSASVGVFVRGAYVSVVQQCFAEETAVVLRYETEGMLSKRLRDMQQRLSSAGKLLTLSCPAKNEEYV